MKEYISSRWKVLEPVISHGLDAVVLAIIVHGTSLILKSFLPPEFYESIHRMELMFYLCLCASLSVYTFYVFCLALAVQVVEAWQNAVKHFSDDFAPNQLPPSRSKHEISLKPRKKEKVR